MDYLFVSSSDRLKTTETSSNFSVTLNHPIEHKQCISLCHFSVLNTIYNVTTSNNAISVFRSSTTYNATIPVGAYTAEDLMSALKTALDGNGSGLTYTVSYDNKTFKVTISAGSAFVLLFGTGSNQINSVLGFPSIDTSSATSHTSTYAIDLHSPVLFLKIRELGTQYNASNINDRMTFVIPVQVNSGEMITFNDNSYFEQKRDIHNRVISQLHLEIVDKNNQPVDFNGSETTFIFSLN